MELLFKDEVYAIMGAAIEVHRELGNGFLEPVYQESLAIELTERKIPFQAQSALDILYKGKLLNKKYEPDFIAFEVPELIGSGRPISKEQPGSVKKFVKAIKGITRRSVPLCGAGISTGDDVRAALGLGTRGVLVASAVVKAKNPEKVLRSFALSTKKR